MGKTLNYPLEYTKGLLPRERKDKTITIFSISELGSLYLRVRYSWTGVLRYIFYWELQKYNKRNFKKYLHRESDLKPTVEFVCKNCGKIFVPPYSRGAYREFCSDKCYIEFTRKRDREKYQRLSPEQRKTKIENIRKKYEKRRKLFQRITINGDHIGIPKELRKHFEMKNIEKVKIYIDTDNNLLGIAQTGKWEEGCRLGISGIISARSLLKYNIKRGKYDAHWSEKKNMIIVEGIKFNE